MASYPPETELPSYVEPAVVHDKSNGGVQDAAPPAPPAGMHATPGQARDPMPVQSLERYPALVECPSCHHVATTRIELEDGSKTHLTAAILCLCCCLGCIPYCCDSLKDVNHFCANCNTPLKTWKA